jgi:hypothetical protein
VLKVEIVLLKAANSPEPGAYVSHTVRVTGVWEDEEAEDVVVDVTWLEVLVVGITVVVPPGAVDVTVAVVLDGLIVSA